MSIVDNKKKALLDYLGEQGGNVEDLEYKYLTEYLGTTGNIEDLRISFYKDVTGSSSGNIADLYKDFIESVGYSSEYDYFSAISKGEASLPSLFYALFGSKTTTLADGTRQLVNEGKIGKDRIKYLINDDFSGGVNDWVTEGHVLVDNSEEALTLTSGEGTSKYWQNYVSQNNIKLEGKAGVEYVVEIEHLSGLRFVVVLDGAVSWTARYTPAVGSLKFSFITENTQNLRMRVYLDTNLPNIVGTIDNIKLYKKSDLAQHGTLHSGHGAYFNGVDNYVLVGNSNPVNNAAFIVDFVVPSSTGHLLSRDWQQSIHYNKDSNSLYFSSGAGYTDVQVSLGLAGLTVGDYVSLYVVKNISTGLTDVLLNGTHYQQIQLKEGYNDYSGVAIASAGGASSFLQCEVYSVYCFDLPYSVSIGIQHYNNPEQTLYWENGTLKSAFLPQSTLDDMQAGNGFWYPLSENVSAGGYYRNHALPMPENLVVNGDFSDGMTGWYHSDTDWSNANNRAYLNTDGSVFKPLVNAVSLEQNTTYVIELTTEIAQGKLKFLIKTSLDDSVDVIQSSAWNMDVSGSYRFIFTTTETAIYPAISRQNSGQVTEAYLDNIKVYPLADSGLAPMANWQTTNTTNAQASQYGYQSLLMPSDEFGLQGDGDVAVVKQDNGKYFNGVDNYIDTGFIPDLSQDLTLLFSHDATLTETYEAATGSDGNRLFVLDNGSIGYGTSYFDKVASVKTDNGSYTTGLVYDSQTSTIKIYRNSIEVFSESVVVGSSLYSIYIGALNLTNSASKYYTNSVSDVYLIPQSLTAQEIEAHYRNPNRTLYWQGGVLKSDFLPQSTIDAMQAGEGFWYPLSGNESTGGYERNHALAMPALLMDEGFESQGNWVTINSSAFFDGNAAVTTTASYGAIFKDNLGFAQSGFIIEFEVVSITNGQAVLNLYDQNNEIDQTTTSLRFDVGVHRVFSPIVGLKKVSLRLDTANETVRFDNIKVYPLADSGLVPMANWNTTNVTNALGVSTSTVTESYTVDEFGMQKDWPDAKPVITGELYGDGRSYVDMNDMVISGDFEIDIYIGSQTEGKISRVLKFAHYDSSGTSLAQSFIQTLEGVDAYNVVPFGAADSVYSYPSSGDVVTVIFASGTRSIYHNNLLQKTTNTAIDLANSVLQDLTLRKAGTGTIQITEGTRTDEQRAKDIQKLATKHGVII